LEPLTDAELEVMTILWSDGEMKPQEILERFPRAITNSTLRSFLTDLVEKGHVTRVRRGKAYFYRPLTKRDSIFRSRLGQFVELFCEGSPWVLVKHLIEGDKLTKEELEELQRLAADSENTSGGQP
jgi:predicted transcriptional regulator